MDLSWDDAMTDCAEETCPVARAVRVLDGKWTMLVIRDLEQHGLVERTSYAEIPPRVEYRLTPAGRTLEPVLAALADWGRTVAAGTAPAPRG